MVLMPFRCCGRNPCGTIRVYGWGTTEIEALTQAQRGAWEYIMEYEYTFLDNWTFTIEDRTREYQMVRSTNMQGNNRRTRSKFPDI